MIAIVSLVAFLIGSVPFGLLIAKLFKVSDLRSHGSGNIGTTNVVRVLGFWPAGAVTFALDVLKGVIPVWIVSPSGASFCSNALGLVLPEFSETAIWTLGMCAVLGHCFSPWLLFKGGKGVATGFGVLAVLSPLAAIGGILAFALAFFTTKIGSLGSLFGVCIAMIVQLVWYSVGPHLLFGAIMVSIIIFKHSSNIDRLLSGSEKALKGG